MSDGQVISGVGTYFALDDDVGGTLTDISTFLNSVQGANDQDELDGTNFQPGVADPVKNFIPGFSSRSFNIGGNWSEDAEVFFSAVNGKSGLNYQYGPRGTDTGRVKLSGTCSLLGYTGPQSSVSGITTFSARVRVSTRVVGTF